MQDRDHPGQPQPLPGPAAGALGAELWVFFLMSHPPSSFHPAQCLVPLPPHRRPWMTEACPALVSPTSGCLQHEPVVVQPQTAGPSPSPCSQHSVSWVQGAGRSHKHPQGAEPLQHSPVCPDTNGSTCTASAQTATNGPVLPKAAALLPPIYSRRGACELQRRGARVAAGFDQDKAARGAPGGGRSGAVPGLSTRWL